MEENKDYITLQTILASLNEQSLEIEKLQQQQVYHRMLHLKNKRNKIKNGKTKKSRYECAPNRAQDLFFVPKSFAFRFPFCVSVLPP